jgi:pSer/pThr/pTyr-binding forkhead associated (FHA) protein
MAKRTTKPPDDADKTKATSDDRKKKAMHDALEPPPPKTKTLPESQRGPWLELPDVVMTLRIHGSATEFALAANVKRFTLGSKDCDVTINDASISRTHCLLERRGGALRVTDASSHNGTFFDGRRLDSFDVRPGNTFTVASTRLLALNDEMRAAYSSLASVLGTEDEQNANVGDTTPSELILIATSGAHVLVLGEPGCDQEQLARTMHGISLRRTRDLVELADVPSDRALQREILDRASKSTLVISISADTPVMDGTFASSLFSSSYQIRIVALAPTTSKAAAVLGKENIPTMRTISLRPVSMRVGAIPRLLDQMFVERATPLRVSDLTRSNQQALQAYAWPENLDSLREAADRLTVIARAPSMRSAAETLALARTSLEYWFSDKLGLSMPLVGA